MLSVKVTCNDEHMITSNFARSLKEDLESGPSVLGCAVHIKDKDRLFEMAVWYEFNQNVFVFEVGADLVANVCVFFSK